jgi:hypothetical protein
MNKPILFIFKYSGQQGSYVSGQVRGKNNNEQTKKWTVMNCDESHMTRNQGWQTLVFLQSGYLRF